MLREARALQGDDGIAFPRVYRRYITLPKDAGSKSVIIDAYRQQGQEKEGL